MISPAVATDKGYEVFMYFHNEALKYEGYDYSWDAIRSYLLSKSPNFFQLLGKTAINSGLSASGLQQKMIDLADVNGGKLPASLSEFLRSIDAVEIHEWSVFDTTKAVAQGIEEGSQQIAEKVSEVGEAAGQGILSSLKILPIILLVGVGIYAFARGGGSVKFR